MLWIGAVAVGVAYGGAVAFMYTYQNRLMYPGSETTVSPEAVGLEPVGEVRIEAPDGVALRSWWMPPAPGRPVVLYFHGNAGSLADRRVKFERFAEAGYGLLMPAYRGYSGNDGRPSQELLVQDAQAAGSWLSVHGYGEQVILFGESLGSAVALHVADKVKPRAIVLEGAFDSAAAMAQARYPILPASLLIKDRWDSVDRAPDVSVPVLMLHSENDRVVPIKHALRLFERFREPKHFVRIERANHVDLFEHGGAEIALEWLASHDL